MTPLAFLRISTFYQFFSSRNSNLTFLILGKMSRFWYQRFFSKTIKFIQWCFQMRNFNCSAGEVTEGFKTSACLFTFCWQKYYFAYGRRRFHFKSAKWTGNFVVCSLKVSLRIISFRHLFGLSVWNFGCLRINRA